MSQSKQYQLGMVVFVLAPLDQVLTDSKSIRILPDTWTSVSFVLFDDFEDGPHVTVQISFPNLLTSISFLRIPNDKTHAQVRRQDAEFTFLR